MAERITPASVAAELDVLDGEAKVVAGQVVVSIGFTNASVKQLVPREWEALAAWLFALIERAPIKGDSAAFAPQRIVLGALAMELCGFAQQAGEPVGLQVDLRSAGSKAEERRIRERMADDAAAFSRHIDDVLEAQEAQKSAAAMPHEEDTPAAPSSEPDDDLAFL